MRSHYDTLSIEQKKTDESEQDFQARLRKAYISSMRAQHPDHGGDSSAAAELNEAYTTLSDATARSLYDQELPLKRELITSNQRAFDLARSFDNCFDWIVCICRTVQAVREHTRSRLSFGASDRTIAEIHQYASTQNAAKLQTTLNAFIESDSHWDTTSARTLFFDLLIMRRSFATPESRQEEAIRSTRALCTQYFDQPPATTDIAAESDRDSIEQVLNQGARNILAINAQISFICKHLTAAQQAGCSRLNKLHIKRRQAITLQSAQAREHRRFAIAIADLERCNPGATTLALTLEQMTLKQLAAAEEDRTETQAAITRLQHSLREQAPGCTLFARPAIKGCVEEEAKPSSPIVNLRKLSMSSID